jgi:hypothetical protein
MKKEIIQKLKENGFGEVIVLSHGICMSSGMKGFG